MAYETTVLCPLPSPLASATNVRGTLIASSLQTLRTAGLLDRYYASLPAMAAPTIRALIGPAWYPIDVGAVHYETCDALGLGDSEILRIAQSVTHALSGTLLKTAATLAGQSGASPLTLLKHSERIWSRAFLGSGVYVAQVGPKEVVAEIVQNPLTRIPYFRTALRGILTAMTTVLARVAFVKEIPGKSRPERPIFRVSWA